MTDTQHWQDILRRVYHDRTFICALPALAPAHHISKALLEFGARDVLCVAASRGTGAPGEELFSSPPVILDEHMSLSGPPSADAMSSIRHALKLFRSIPDEVAQQIDAFDPGGEALSIGPIFDDGTPLLGRPKFGARPRSWQALEDKTIIDALWQRAGVQHAAHCVSDFETGALTSSYHDMNRYGRGSVFAVDNGEGFHGGASGTQWIQSVAHIEEFLEHFSGSGIQKVRVMPFLDGLPCSIHGIVFPDGTITLRPCEMLVFHAPGTRQFHYAGSATFWEPEVHHRDHMREVAHVVGEHLRHHESYRGAFTIDGVMTPDQGFLPTELNPRFGAAMGYLGASLPEISLLLLNLAVVEGVEADWQSPQLETLLRKAADAHPRGSLGMHVTEPPARAWELPLHSAATGGWHIAAKNQDIHAFLDYGASGAGGYLRAGPSRAHLPSTGRPFAPVALNLLRFAAQTFGLSLRVNDLRCAVDHEV